MQRVTIHAKDKTGKPHHLQHAKMEDAEFERLKSDFLAYVENGQPKGGAYSYVSNEMYSGDDVKSMVLRFDDIHSIT